MTSTSANSAPPPAYKLYDPASVIIATLFGSPAAGAALMAWNERRNGSTRRAVLIFAIGVAVTALAFAFGSLVPSWAGGAVAVGLAVATMSLAKSLQGAAIRQHLERGGRLHSRWTALGLATACLVIVYVAAVMASVIAQRPASNAALRANRPFIASLAGSIRAVGISSQRATAFSSASGVSPFHVVSNSPNYATDNQFTQGALQ